MSNIAQETVAEEFLRSFSHPFNPPTTPIIEIIKKVEYGTGNGLSQDISCLKNPEDHFQVSEVNMEQELQSMIMKFRSFKCSICHCALSIPPVMIISKDGDTYKCGRCRHVQSTDIAVRCTIFESMAENMTFPCSYQDCNEILPWKDVTSHEINCVHKTIKCPVYYQNCHARVKIAELKSHMIKNHFLNIFYEKVVTKIIDDETQSPSHLIYVFLLISNKRQFLVYIFKNEVLLLALEPSINKDYFYILEVGTADKKYPKLIYKYDHIKEFDEKFDCSECFNKKCRLENHPCSTLYSKKNTYKRRLTFDMKKIESFVGTSTVTFTISVNHKEDNESGFGKNYLDHVSIDYNIDIIRKSLECPICDEYMLQPIYSCVTGHVVCKKCKSKLKGCPTCSATILNTRNFALENIAENASLSCVHKQFGCAFSGNLEIMFMHEVDCPFASR